MRLFTSKLRRLLIFLPSLLITSIGFNQSVEAYQGPYGLGNQKGVAKYEFMLFNGDTIKNGTFEFSSSTLQEDSQMGQTAYEVSGHYEGNKLSDRWEFKKTYLRPSNNTKLVDYKYVTTLNGEEDYIIGQFEDGLPQGEWQLSRYRILDSKVTDTIFRSIITYNQGIPQLSAKIYHQNSSLVTRYLRNGMAHDEWTLFNPNAIEPQEIWTFDHGLLKSIQYNDQEGVVIVPIFNDESLDLQEISMDQRFLSVLSNSFPSLDTVQALNNGIFKLLDIQETLLNGVESLLKREEQRIKLAAYKVKVPTYPFEEKEREMLEKLVSLTEESVRIATGILSNSQLNIAKLSDRETAAYFEATDQINRKILKPMTLMVRMDDQNITQYINREKLGNQLFPEGLPFQVFENSALKNLRTHSYPNLQNVRIADLTNLIEDAYASLNFLRQKLSEKASITIREKAIVSEEALLVRKAQNFQSLVNTVSTNASDHVKTTLTSVQEFAENKLTAYANMEDSENKLNTAKALELCYEDLTKLVTSLGSLPVQKKEIRAMYTDDVWNPFTSTIMSENIKRRITNAYEEVVIPYTLTQIQNNLTCDNSADFSDRFKVIEDRMIVLRDMKTNKLERKLRRKSDPEVTLALLGLNTE
ncbi:hypothetical protein [Portibacter marinus]|uniref:hypothetical protein n=1 Tax=Portibacter marinus TaxID=2898660 RepID=UPI001F384EF9|nr:hypothetical protein [Portibacter marinus]